MSGDALAVRVVARRAGRAAAAVTAALLAGVLVSGCSLEPAGAAGATRALQSSRSSSG